MAAATYCSRTTTGPPCGPGAEIGTPYPFKLFTHCGILGAYFDARFWRAEPQLSDGSGNPPPGWGNPYEVGEMRLLSRDVSEFRSRTDSHARFVPGFVKFYCD
jgi:hypothetical protein